MVKRTLNWENDLEIADALAEAHPDFLAPYDLEPDELVEMIIDLPEFVGDETPPSDVALESIRYAWNHAVTNGPLPIEGAR